MATYGRLEGRITVPTGGWDLSVTDGTGNATVTIPAGNYYLKEGQADSIIDALETQLNATMTDTFSVSSATGEGGTGKVTITNDSSNNTSITWTDTDARDVLGFESDGNLSAATSYTSTEQARSLWLPDRPYWAKVAGAWRGNIETDLKTTESSAGHVFAFGGQKKRVLNIRWQAVAVSKAWIVHETILNESFEKFFLDVIFGEAAWSARPAGPVRFFRDAGSNDSHTYSITNFSSLSLEQVVKDYTGLYIVELPRMVEVPS